MNAQLRAGFREGRGDLETKFLIFDDTRPGNERESARIGQVFPDAGVVENPG
jgi:hypothetical protein